MADVDGCCGVGALSKLAMGKTNSTLTRMDFIRFVPQVVKTLSDGSVKTIRGTLDHMETSVAQGLLHVRFRTVMYMTAAKMDIILPMLGFTEVANVYTLGDVIPESTLVLAPGSAPEHTFTGLMPSDWIISGQKGADPIMIDIGWVGKTWAQNPSGTYSFGALTEGYTYPFAAQGTGQAATITLGAPYSQTLAMPQVKFAVDNKLVVEFNNSITATNICPTDREIVIGTSALYSTCDGNDDLFSIPMGGNVAGATFSWDLQRTVGTNNQTTINVANVKPIARMPRIIKNDFNRLPLNFNGYATPSTAALMITNINAGA